MQYLTKCRWRYQLYLLNTQPNVNNAFVSFNVNWAKRESINYCKIVRPQNMVINCAINDDRLLKSVLKICAVIYNSTSVNILQSTCLQLTGVLYPWIQNKMLWKWDNKQQWQLLRVYWGPCTVNIWSPDPNTNFWSPIFQDRDLSINVWQHFAIFW